jgi:hypothetical protein
MKFFRSLFLLGFFFVICSIYGSCLTPESISYSNINGTDYSIYLFGQANISHGTHVVLDNMTIDPIEDHYYFGERFFINGTANILSNDTISVKIIADNPITGKNTTGDFFEFSKTAAIVTGTNPKKQWYILVNTSDESAHFIPNESYTAYVTITHPKGVVSGDSWLSASDIPKFTLLTGSRQISPVLTSVTSVSTESKTKLPETRTVQQTASTASPLEQVIPVTALCLIIILIGVKKQKK